MTRSLHSALCVLALAATAAPAQAERWRETPAFAAAPVPASMLAASHGTGSGYGTTYETMLAERTRSEERMFADVNPVSMDVWWAYVGSALIAPNLT